MGLCVSLLAKKVINKTERIRRVGRRKMLERVLQILFYLADHPDVSINSIAKSLHMNNYVCSRYIERMKNWGLVEVRQKGKAKLVRLTKKGYEALIAASRFLSYIPEPIIKAESSK